MERLNRSVAFWILLFVSIALPLSAQKVAKKQLYVAGINNNGAGVGSGSMLLSTSNPEYQIRTFTMPGQTATRVALTGPGWAGEIVICENGGPAGDDCTYDGTGNLDIEGVIVGPMFPPTVTPGQFIGALTGGTLTVQINNGAAGSGVFIRVI